MPAGLPTRAPSAAADGAVQDALPWLATGSSARGPARQDARAPHAVSAPLGRLHRTWPAALTADHRGADLYRKAAAEMRDRLGRRLLRLLRDPEQLAHNRVASEPELCRSASELGQSWPVPAHFESARAQLSAAPIGTFHSFASSLLRRNALLAGIDPDFELLDEQTARDLLGEACERAVLAALDDADDSALAQSTAELVTDFGFAGDHGLVAALCRLLAQRGEEGSQAAGLADPTPIPSCSTRPRPCTPASQRPLTELAGLRPT